MNKFRFLTAGESHGKCLTAIIEGIPAGFEISSELINIDLKRRQSGYGRGDRMKIEADTVEITSGIRFGKTLGSPITLVIQNKDFENWQKIMSVNPEDFTEEKSFTKCRPGHADYSGSIKYNQKDLRNILERSSARKTAIEVAVGSIAKQILAQFDIKCSSRILQIGSLTVESEDQRAEGQEGKPVDEISLSEISQEQQTDNSYTSIPPDLYTSSFHSEIDRVKAMGDTIGGKFEVVFENLPVGLGSFVHWDRMLDGKIAQSVMSIPAIKVVEIGQNPLGFLGSEYHDEMFLENGKIIHKTNNAGGIEGGMTNGEPIIVKAVMKPIPTMRKPLKTVDLATMEESEAHFERSDTCAVEACSVVAEARIACILADEILQKFGGDSLEEILKNYRA
jgi:chorismate synthase